MPLYLGKSHLKIGSMILDQRTKQGVLRLYPAFAYSVLTLFDTVYEQTGKILSMTCGLRTMGEQADLFNQGRISAGKIITNARPGTSAHNFAVAADMCFREGDGYTDMPWEKVCELAEKQGLTSGATFKKLADRDHVECLYGLTMADLNTQWKINGLTAVFDKLDFVRKVKAGQDWNSLLKQLQASLATSAGVTSL